MGTNIIIIDPESFDWTPLDNTMRKRLDDRPYVSLSRERASLSRGTASERKVMGAEDAVHSSGSGQQETDRDAALLQGPAAGLLQGDGHAEEMSSAEEPETSEGSLFDLRMPGILKLEQVKTLVDLDHWSLIANGMLVEMEVCIRIEYSFVERLFVTDRLCFMAGPCCVGILQHPRAPFHQGHHCGAGSGTGPRCCQRLGGYTVLRLPSPLSSSSI